MSPLTLSRRQILHFYHQGYIHLPGLVPPDLLSPARSLIDTSYSLHQYRRSGSNRLGSSLRIPVFDLSVKLAPQLLALVHETGLLNLADSLLGKGNAAVREGKAQVAYMETNEHFVRDGMNDHEPHPKLGWHVDSGIGLYAALCSGFSLLVGVAVSEGQELDVNRGQFTIWPGSHWKTHALLRDIIMEQHTPAHEVLSKLNSMRPDCGAPQRLLLRPGDAFIAHQRLAHASGFNLWPHARKNVYFRIEHADYGRFIAEYINTPHPWIGFHGMERELAELGLTSRYGEDDRSMEKMEAIVTAKATGGTTGARMQLTHAEKIELREKGFVVKKGVMKDWSEKVARKITGMMERKEGEQVGCLVYGEDVKRTVFRKLFGKGEEVLGMFGKGGIVDLIEGVIGKGKVFLYRNWGQVIMTEEGEKGKAGNELKGEVDRGVDRSVDDRFGGEFMVKVGVVVSDGGAEKGRRGQMVVWPGSHELVHRHYAEALRAANNVGKICDDRLKNDVDRITPQRLLLDKGDVYVIHQRLVHGMDVNEDCVQGAAHVVYRVHHVGFEGFKEQYARGEDVWKGFEGMND